MNTTPNQNYNVIKGLQIFINDIRECTTREAESKRVESELDKIRKKFNSTSALTGYEKKKAVRLYKLHTTVLIFLHESVMITTSEHKSIREELLL